ncbi:MAG: hypothetical protein A3C43_08010 [Candidatus Schekmanbacteria bacterium RIFCSPHIGHO2_02_FULL_38_11]|uniref:Uncharacterized protein n=1 Tax=Candidatus Schekmanbacteria bacterium RIFCSPLOWO2_12_FULL_38_15 TaxID=1817883 RepID=A0A1F7SMR2_9BACT|nr:MAG: hypothetical protein A3H37_08280 [Candidatus Schekmanbacteria bacterium RIFCSPLOWO2_02_FULL_38_14]OGL48326.1 MAG: hypothetical protein A3C43_08010 [Candidatus Schekmanbacteria bacterium RIFCSPHIGHO2_02_FULL_38_11]OGL54504.1 MAG: hypothetical protein A3G31_10110 [Candidatus Schekmanbacteria bacterium RIFCSPLOWO2_12_FULL_38_15]
MTAARPFNANLADMIWFFIAIGSIPDLSAFAFGNHSLKDFFPGPVKTELTILVSVIPCLTWNPVIYIKPEFISLQG